VQLLAFEPCNDFACVFSGSVKMENQPFFLKKLDGGLDKGKD